MPLRSQSARWPRAGRRPFTGLLVSLLLLLVVFSSGPLIHRLLHADALAAKHECVINTFAAGHVVSADAVTLVIVETPGSVGAGLRSVPRPRQECDYRLAPTRGPPGFSALPIG